MPRYGRVRQIAAGEAVERHARLGRDPAQGGRRRPRDEVACADGNESWLVRWRAAAAPQAGRGRRTATLTTKLTPTGAGRDGRGAQPRAAALGRSTRSGA